MMKKFLSNRIAVQKAMYLQNYIERWTETAYTIEESKNEQHKLQSLHLENIPIPEDGDQCIWVVDFELEETAFRAPEGFKKTEKALIFYNHGRLYILLVEMKQQLKPFGSGSGFDELLQKIEDSVSRILLQLPTFVFYDEMYEDLSVRFYTLVTYNKEAIKQFIASQKKLPADERLQTYVDNQLFDAFESSQQPKKIKIDTRLNTKDNVWVIFAQNENPNEPEMTLDLQEVLPELSDESFDGRFVCPHIEQ